MISDYIVSNRFYLKGYIGIECALKLPNGSTSSDHEVVFLMDDYIDLIKVDEHEFIFKYDGHTYVYWCDVSIFTQSHCKTKEQVRDLRLKDLIN